MRAAGGVAGFPLPSQLKWHFDSVNAGRYMLSSVARSPKPKRKPRIKSQFLGAIAFDEKSKGEKVHGIASAHGPVALVTAGAFGAALLSVSLKL